MVTSERKRAYDRAWRAANRERISAYNKAWQEANPERAKALQKAWKERNEEQQRAYREANRDRARTRNRVWNAANPDKVAAWKPRRRALIAAAPVIERVDRAAIVARDGSRCHLCGGLVPKGQLELDHIVPLSRGGEHSARNLAVAHRACNRRKGTRLAAEMVRRRS